jgi:hypothetical protein
MRSAGSGELTAVGMFDYLVCEATLPDGFDAAGVEFQTKSLPECCLWHYRITSDGRLLDSWGRDHEPDGYISFYTDDENADPNETGARWHNRREYRAYFRDGRLQSIVRMSRELDEAEPNRISGLSSIRWYALPDKTSLPDAPTDPVT